MKKNSFMLKVLRIGEAQYATKINTPQRAIRYWQTIVGRQPWYDQDKEQLVVLILSTKHDIQGYSLVSVGSLNESIAAPRETFRAAVASGAYGIVAMHNHPSGDPTPSHYDRESMLRLDEAGKILAIRVVDQIIVGKNGRYYSWCEQTRAMAERKERERRKRQKARRANQRR